MDGRGSPTTVQFSTVSLPLITVVLLGGMIISGSTTILIFNISTHYSINKIF